MNEHYYICLAKNRMFFERRCHAFLTQYKTGSFHFSFPHNTCVSNKTGQNNTKIKYPCMHTTLSPESTRNYKNLAFPLQCFAHGAISWVACLRIMKALNKITSFECLQRNNSLGSVNSECMNWRRPLKVRTITERGK